MNDSDALRDLVSFVQFLKREKHPWRSATELAQNYKKNGPQQGETRCKKGFSDGQVNAKNIWAKLYEKILKGSEEKEKLKPKNTSKWHTTEGDMI